MPGFKAKPLPERLWAKVDIRGEDECWEWRGARLASGYGFMRVGSQKDGTRGIKLAHRVAFETTGESADGLIVRHTCDNPPCCNPKHLVGGTQKDNVGDMLIRGRNKTRLTREQVIAIRTEYVRGVITQQMLADAYGVAQSTIGRIVSGKTWA